MKRHLNKLGLKRLVVAVIFISLFAPEPESDARGTSKGRTSVSANVSANGTTPVAEGGSSDTTGASNFNTSLPPEFKASQATGFANIWTSCMNFSAPLGQLGDILQGMPAGPISAGTSCPASGNAVSENLDCADVQIGKKFSQRKLDDLLKQSKTSLAGLSCEKYKFQAIQGELGCMSSQAQQLSQQVGSLQQAYTNNIQRMQADVTKLKAIEDDRNQQRVETQKRLQGNNDTGRDGLLPLQANMQKLVVQMPADVQDVRDRLSVLNEQRKSLLEQVDTRKSALTVQCFKTRQEPRFRCTPNGPAVSAMDYALCRYEQNQYLGNNGVIERDADTDAKAQANKAGLASLLANIFGDAPTDATVKTAPNIGGGAPAGLLDNPNTILHPDDVAAQYGDQLANYNANGLDIKAFILKSMKSCYTYSETIVNGERKRANTSIGVAEFQIKGLERTYNNRINTLLAQYAQSYDQMTRALTGVSVPLNISACQGTKPENQANCIDDLRRNVEGLVTGATKQSTVAMIIRGANPATTISFTCAGLNGCITKLQNISSNLDAEINKVKAFKTDYIVKANQNIERFTNQIAATLSPQSQGLANRIKQLNVALSSLGVGEGMTINPVACEDYTQDTARFDGLYSPPKNALSLVGCKMNPPLLDVNSNTFGTALSGLSQGVKDNSEKLAKANKAIGELQRLAQACPLQQLDTMAESVNNKLQRLVDKCSDLPFCGGAEKKYTQLAQVVESLSSEGGSGESGGSFESLASGLDECTDTGGTTGQTESELKTDPHYRPPNPKRCAAIYNDVQSRVERLKNSQRSYNRDLAGQGE